MKATQDVYVRLKKPIVRIYLSPWPLRCPCSWAIRLTIGTGPCWINVQIWWNTYPHHDQLPIGLIAQRVEHCTGIAEVRFESLFQVFLATAEAAIRNCKDHTHSLKNTGAILVSIRRSSFIHRSKNPRSDLNFSGLSCYCVSSEKKNLQGSHTFILIRRFMYTIITTSVFLK